ncbi:hypothetical protein [Nonomuraea wenchangensis]|uniref:Uncharacterized protein n=1 Tax=Nonomuraea wenchangensis TaxID=568860 RepID=A0A1I0LWZ1_9ACTN|nr:hypothetical protein [Nonomuraea wenchangensis]SEU47822.1 hypothetical protein SAMN05421811_13213 [Nonomuraea wenchangensis]
MGLLEEVGKKFAERWLTLLVLPGALFLCALYAAVSLDGFDFAALAREADRFDAKNRGDGFALLFLVVFGLLSAAAGLAVSALGTLVERLWLAERWTAWPVPLYRAALWRVTARARAWDAAFAAQEELRRRYLRGLIPGAEPSGVTERDVLRARARVTGKCPERPGRPTWMGSRIQAVTDRFWAECSLDLPSVWPSLWLFLPDTTRTELRQAREALTRAAALAAWAVPYLAAALWWWPALLLPPALAAAGWRRGRRAAEAYALLMEATVRLHGPGLAASLGLVQVGPLDTTLGERLTLVTQGRSYLLPLTESRPGE